MELIQWWRNYMRDAPSHPPHAVNGGPLLDNVLEGKDVNLQENTDAGLARARRRAVHRHRLPGGDEGPGFAAGSTTAPTACRRQEPDRRDRDDVARQAWPDHHGQISRARRAVPGRGHRRHAPGAVHAGGLEIPYGKNEIEAAGGILGEPVEVINMPKTGLPVPANCEIAFEGFIHPDDNDAGRAARRMDRLLRRRQPPGARDPHCHA